MEILVNSQSISTSFDNSISIFSSTPSNSSRNSEDKKVAIEIQIHSKDEPNCSSFSSLDISSSIQTEVSKPQSKTVDPRFHFNTNLQEHKDALEYRQSSSSLSSHQNKNAPVIPNGCNDNRQVTKLDLHQNVDRGSNSRIQIKFDMFNGGNITEKEVKKAILLNASANKLFISQEEAGEYAHLIIEDLDGKEDIKSPNLYFLPPHSATMPTSHVSNLYRVKLSVIEVFFRAYWRRAWVIFLWLTACITLFMWKFLQYRHRSAFEVMGYCLCTAKGAAETLKLNMALVLLPICRNTLTWLRKSRRLSSIIPFNDNINFHKMIAGGIVIGVILHGGTHLTCDFPRIAGANRMIFHNTIADDFEHRQPSYMEILISTEVVTGIAMVVLMIVAFSLATRLPRRHPSSLPWPIKQFVGFNAFWYSHHLFIVVYVLLIVHSMFLFLTKDVTEKTTWMYITIPVIIYIGERIVRAIRAGLYEVKIFKARVYPGKVLSLKLQKPPSFRYCSGMYIFVKCPHVSQFEWHPFSLTSAPSDDHLSLHIRTLGDWSYQIYSLFQEALTSGSCIFPKLCIDGPYGTASQDYINYDIVLLIGLGIGATPFISILRDIANGLKGPLLDSIDGAESFNTNGPRKAYFYWVTREQSSFDWFRDIMKEVSLANGKQTVIEIHNYLTSVFKEGDKRSALISSVQSLYHAKTGVDIISRTPIKTEFARPNWYRVFSGIANRHGGERIGVFYCGPETLARELQKFSNKMTITTSTRFVFHKEYY